MSTIHVGNLSFNLGEKDLEDYFSKYGKVVDSYIVRRGGRPRGYGFVEFSASKEADNALAANGEDMNGRVINIELAKGKIVKSNFQNDDDDGNGSGNGNDRPRNNYGGNGGNFNRNYNNNGGNGGYRNNNDGGYRNNNDGGYRNNNDGGYRNYNNNDGGNGGYRNNNDGGYRNNYNNGGYNRNYDGGQNRGPRLFNRGGRNFYTLKPQGYGRRNFNNGNNDNRDNRGGNRSNFVKKPDSEKEKSLTSVYVSNLPFSYDEKELANLFSDFKVKTAHVVITKNGRSKGFGFVEFETEGDQDAAVKAKDQFTVKGSDGQDRILSVKASLVDKHPETTSTGNGNTGNGNTTNTGSTGNGNTANTGSTGSTGNTTGKSNW
jgi:RNA recognition motif-containing protein